MTYLLAVDVGTISARAGLFDAAGALIATGTGSFELLKPLDDHAVYRMDDIWQAAGTAVRAALAAAPEAAGTLRGIAFDATSSLGLYPDLFAALEAIAPAQCPLPRDRTWSHAHDAAYRIYLKLFATRSEIDAEARALLAASAAMS